MINNERRSFKGVWIPAKIWLNNELSLLEKCLLVEINSLDNDDGCYASNEYLAEFLNTSEPTISRAIARLKVIGDIYQKSFNGRQRSLSVKNGILEPNQNDKADESKCVGSHINLSKSSIDNNTINNKDNIPVKVKKPRTPTPIEAYYRDLWEKAMGMKLDALSGHECVLLNTFAKGREDWAKALDIYFSFEWTKGVNFAIRAFVKTETQRQINIILRRGAFGDEIREAKRELEQIRKLMDNTKTKEEWEKYKPRYDELDMKIYSYEKRENAVRKKS